MKRNNRRLLGFTFGILSLSPITVSAALVEYSGSRSLVIDGVERDVSLSITIDDAFNMSHSTVQYMYDHYSPDIMVNGYYGYFDLHNSELNIDGSEPITGNSGKYYIWVTGATGRDDDVSALRLETEDVVTDWSQHSRIQFLDELGEPYDWSSWWGDAPTNELPPLLGVTRLDILAAGDNSGYYYLDSDPMLLRPVPIPAAVWLFGSGILGLLGVARRNNI
jgi:hypothetical protein